MSHYFGTNGVRGRFDELTPSLALKLAQAIGRYFKGGKVLVARDCRLTGPILRSAVISGLSSVGCETIDLGVVSSPTAEFMLKRLEADGCVIITASHNTPEWNALKVVDEQGIAVSRERGGDIERLLEGDLADWDKVGAISSHGSATQEHIDAIVELVDADRIMEREPRLVLDCGNGTASVIAERLFKKLGCECIMLNEDLDGTFPGRPSEPTERNVQGLIRKVKAEKADAGIAWDADGDRVIFVDEMGRYIIGDKAFALSMLWKLGKSEGDVVTTVATSKAVEDVASRFGSAVHYTAIGAPYLSERMHELGDGAALGGEEVGGIIWPELSLAKDGFMTGAKLAEALCEKPLSAWLDELPVYFNVKIKVPAKGEEKDEMVGRVLRYAKAKKLESIDVDGVRVDFKDAWVIVRPSGTEDCIRIFAEAKTRKEAERLVEEFRKIATG